MKGTANASMILFSIIISLLIASSPCTAQDFYAKANANSPNGSVPHGTKAYSPDGKYYVKEVPPYEEGNIAVCEVNTDKEIQRWDLLPTRWPASTNRPSVPRSRPRQQYA